MKIKLLGTGTSQGVPVIGCNCDTCRSSNSRDNRTRASVLIETASSRVVIDVGPDFRSQMLRYDIADVDAALLTHEHNDHVLGLDDLRPIMFRAGKPFPLYAESRVLSEVKKRFPYAFEAQPYPGAPQFAMHEIAPDTTITIAGIEINVLRVWHGKLPIVGVRIGDFAYLTDTNFIPEETLVRLQGLRFLVIDALREEPHYSHFNLAGALESIERIAPDEAYLTHISHHMAPYDILAQKLPDQVLPAYDGLQFEL